MTRPISVAQFNRGLRFIRLAMLFVMTGAIALLSFAAFAQDVLPTPAVSTPTTPDTIMGWVLKTLLAVLIAAAVWGAKKLTDFIAVKTAATGQTGAQQMKWSLIQTAWLKAQAVGGKLLAKEKPLLDKILADGVVTADEFVSFKNAVLIDLRDQLTEELPMLGSLFGGAGAVSSLLDGFATKVAHGLISGAPQTISSAPMNLPAPVAAPAPAAAAPAVAKSP